MENRERDRMSQRDSSTDAGRLNRDVESQKGREHNSGTSAEFGQKIGRSENLEGGNVNNNRKQGSDVSSDQGRGGESSRRSTGSNYSSSTGRRSGSMDNSERSNISPGRNSSSGELGNSGEVGHSGGSSSSRGDSSEGRH
jgi:hypothetical protein